MASPLRRAYAVLWLHAKRLRRLGMNLVDYTVSTALWASINALMLIAVYGPGVGEKLAVATIPWLYYMVTLSTTAGWINYYMATGVAEYELYLGHNPMWTVAGRIILSATAGTASSTLMALLLGLRPSLELAASCIAAMLVGHSYGLLITALGATRGVPGSILDLLGYASGLFGGLLLPLRDYPEPLRLVALATPLAPLGELARAAVIPGYTILPAGEAIAMILGWLAVLYAAAYIASKRFEWKARKEGVKTTRY